MFLETPKENNKSTVLEKKELTCLDTCVLPMLFSFRMFSKNKTIMSLQCNESFFNAFPLGALSARLLTASSVNGQSQGPQMFHKKRGSTKHPRN